jgi:Tol biopolymer transport system component
MTHQATAAGVILGTAAYMSPEQARGRAVDRRTDIFSFGCVLYECLTGRQVFGGETVTDSMARILEREPDWAALPASTPERIRRLLQRCLEKDPRRRQRDIGDARLAFEELERARTSSVPADASPVEPAAARSRGSSLVAWGVALVAVAVAVGTIVLSNRTPEVAPASPVRFTIESPAGVRTAPWTPGIHIAPDGRYVTWSVLSDPGARGGNAGAWMRSLDALESHQIAGVGPAIFNFLSPDGEWLGYQYEGKLRRIRIDGGDPEPICDANSSRGASWGRDTIVFALADGPLYRVPVAGGTPEPITELNAERGETTHRFPHFLPDGETFLYVTLPARSGRFGVFAGDVHGREPVEIMTAVSSPVYAEPGYLLFQIGNRVMAQRFDAEKLALEGKPIEISRAPRRPSAAGAPAVSASRNGYLAMLTPEERLTEMLWLDRSGQVTETLDLEPARYEAPAISPDGRFIAFTKVVSPEESDIWVVELERKALTRVTFGPGRSADAVWAPDGTSIAYSTDKDGPWNIYRSPFPGGGDPLPVAVGPATFKNPLDWSPDGNYFLFEQIGSGTNMDLWIVPMDGSGEPRRYLAETYQEDQAKFSPDGNWVAYQSNETGSIATYVNSFPVPGRKQRISVGTGINPAWSPDGSAVLYNSGGGAVMRVPVRTSPSFSAGTPELLLQQDKSTLLDATASSGLNITVAPDGERFLQLRSRSNPAPASVTVVLNWATGLGE